MGETHEVTINSAETPAEAPDAPDVKVSEMQSYGVSIPTDQDGVEEAEETERPEWLPEKFENAEAMAKAYSALEGKLGGAEDAEVEDDEGPVAEGTMAPSDLQPFYDEFAESGDLTEEAFVSLEKMGLERGLVRAFMEGQVAKHTAELDKIYESAGGKETYATAIGWAVSTLSPDEIETYNDQVESGDMAAAHMAVQGLMARYHQSGVSGRNQPHLLKTEPTGPGGPAPYESVAQVMKDMNSADYKTDPAFRDKVKQKLARSNVM